MLTGLNQPTSGTGRVVGFDIRTEYEQIKKHIGYMSQRFSLYEDLTVAENIRLFAGIYGMKPDEVSGFVALRLEAEAGLLSLDIPRPRCGVPRRTHGWC